VLSVVFLVIDVCLAAEDHFPDPEEAVAKPAGRLADLLAGMGITDSMALFLGGGVDMSIGGCELKLTRVFRRLDDARAAAQQMGRPQFIVMSWRTDASGSLTLADSG
jgi:hypothetical protein